MTSTNPRVLLLEDNATLAESIVFALATYQLDVLGPYATNDLSDCALTKENITAGILDLELENGTSVPTAERLREAGIPFLFMSGHQLEDELPVEFQNEICLPKPVAPEVLAEVIEELRANRAAATQSEPAET